MPKLFKIFFWGLLISSLGTLPLGMLNVAAMQISVSEGVNNALYFSCGAVLAEVLYVRVSLVGMGWVRKQKNLLEWMDWIALLIVVALAIGSFYAALHPHQGKNALLQNNIHRFLLGLLMSAINPAQIPFWFGWSTILISKKVLMPEARHYNIYIVGIGIGSLIGLSVFVFGGQLLVDKLIANQSMLNYIIGGIFTLTAILQIIKILRHKGTSDAVQNTNRLAE